MSNKSSRVAFIPLPRGCFTIAISMNDCLFDAAFELHPSPSLSLSVHCVEPMFVCYLCVLYYALLSIRIYNPSLDYVWDADLIYVVAVRSRVLKTDCASVFHTIISTTHCRCFECQQNIIAQIQYHTKQTDLIVVHFSLHVCVRFTSEVMFVRIILWGRILRLVRNRL